MTSKPAIVFASRLVKQVSNVLLIMNIKTATVSVSMLVKQVTNVAFDLGKPEYDH